MLTIFGVPISVHTRKVIVTAILKNIDYVNEPVIPFDPPENWRELSPTGLIPAISHDGFELAESSAICAYLDRLRPSPSIYPMDARSYGRALWLEQYGTNVVFKDVIRPLFHQKIIGPLILKRGGPDEAEIRRIVEQVAPGVFDYLEDHATEDLCLAAMPNIAAITVACNLMNYQYLGFRIDSTRYPRLSEGFARTLEHKAFRRALQAEEPFATRLGLDQSFLAQLRPADQMAS